MATQLLNAKRGNITDEMQYVSDTEGIDVKVIQEKVAQGKVVILKNNTRTDSKPTAIGEGLRTKVSATVGITDKNTTMDKELDKVRVIEQAGADVLMDLSIGNLIDETRQAILSSTKLPVGVNPLLQIAINSQQSKKNKLILSKDTILSTIEKICSDGCDFLILDCAATRKLYEHLKNQKRKMGITTQTGLILAQYIETTKSENPLYEYFSDILEIVKPYDMTIYIANTMKASCIEDSGDIVQYAEIITQGELAKKARQNGVQVMIENVGHLALRDIKTTMRTIKNLTDNAPLCTNAMISESTIGHDHINNAIASTIVGIHGANMFNCVPAYENTVCTTPTQARESIIAAKISANCADLAKRNINSIKTNEASINAKIKKDWKKQKDNAPDKLAMNSIEKQYKLENYFSFLEDENIKKLYIK